MRLGVAAVFKVVVAAGVLYANYFAIPASNTKLTHFDTLIVLGQPPKPDGTLAPELRERVLEGVREYKVGVAGHVIMTGGPTHNNLVEAHAMKMFAEAQGVPAEAIVEEGQAMDTIQNIYFSEKVMEQRGWKSAEVVSSPSHLPRAALILQHYSFAWRTHASKWPRSFRRRILPHIFAEKRRGAGR